MKIVDNILKRAGYIKENIPSKTKTGNRSYQAGKFTRLTSDWIATSDSIHREIRTDMVSVRSRARDLHKNNSYVRGYFLDNRANVVGPKGPTLQVRGMFPDGREDTAANEYIESMFQEWCEPEFCTMAGILDFVELQWMLANQLKRDGEFMVRMVTGENVNKFGFSLQLIEPDALDEKFTMKLSNGNYAIMGVEINEWKKPVAFWIRTQNAETEYMGVYGFNYQPTANLYGLQRIPAEEIIFGYDPEHTNQLRGMSHLAAAMLTIHHLQGYDEAAIVNARAGASKMGFISDKDGIPGDYKGDEEDEDGNTISNFQSGIIEDIGNRQFTAFDPTYPHGEYPSFRKEHLRETSIGLGRNYNSFAGDLEGVSFSSLRGGELQQRQIWMVDQELFLKKLDKPVYKNWLKWAMLYEAVKLPYAKYEKFAKHEWQPVRWPWVDPLKDVQAEIMAIDHGLQTRKDALAKQGKDFEQNIEQLAKEKAMADKLGIKFGELTNGKAKLGTDTQSGDGQDANTSSSTDGTGDSGSREEDSTVPRLIRIPG